MDSLCDVELSMEREDEHDLKSEPRLSTSLNRKDFFKRWAKSCKKRSRMHQTLSIRARYKHQMLTVPTIVVSTVASAMSYSTISNQSDTSSSTSENFIRVMNQIQTTQTQPSLVTRLAVWVAVLSTISTILIGITNFFEFGKQSEKHLQACLRYELLALDVKKFLSRSHNNGEWDETYQKISTQYQDIVLHAPLLQEAVSDDDIE